MSNMDNSRNMPTRAQVSRSSIQRLYIAMRHLFIRGMYKPLGISGEAMIHSMLELKPEIYGSIADPEKVELTGLLYIFQRLPLGVEQCRFIKLIGKEGFENAFTPIIPSKRRRNCFKIDEEQMYIEMSRGRSDIYDVLTHITFMCIESEKIRRNALDGKDRKTRAWNMLEETIEKIKNGEEFNEDVGYTYLSTLLGRTYNETMDACRKFAKADKVSSLFEITYWLGKLSIDEHLEDIDREVSFSSSLREKLGHHIYGEIWASDIKRFLIEKNLHNRPIHIVSSNMHSVLNSIYAADALKKNVKTDNLEEIAEYLSNDKNAKQRDKVLKHAEKHGLFFIKDSSGTNINVQIIDLAQVDLATLPKEIHTASATSSDVIIVMDYAFGEQAYETMDELLKPLDHGEDRIHFDIRSVNVMGKAGILTGVKGDIMIPTAHVFEGSADNYPFNNDLEKVDFTDDEVTTYIGPMITVLGTSLQNKDILRYFMKSSWGVIGLEMEGAHYQKAIQSASKIRKSVNSDIVLRYAYYASDNPLETGSTLASGSLGLDGVKPTYMITSRILSGILSQQSTA